MWRLVCFSLLATFACATDSYIRTEKYDDELIVRWYKIIFVTTTIANTFLFSNNVSRVHYQAILDQPGMDIWSAANGGSQLDVRVPRDDVMRLKQLGVHCTTLYENVEQLVSKFEKSLSVKQEWFEEYVSIAKVIPNESRSTKSFLSYHCSQKHVIVGG